MRAGRRSLSLQYAVTVIAVSLSAVVACAVSKDVQENKKALALLDTCPALFVEDSGNFVHRGKGANILLSEADVTFQLFDKSGSETATDSFRVTFPGSRTVRPEGLGKSDAQFNYYTGNNPAQWCTGLPTFEKVIYRGLYPGIDLVVHGLRSHVKYEFIVSPGADYSVISVAYHDILGLSLDADGPSTGSGSPKGGSLYVQTALGEVVEDAPYVYQTSNGVNRQVACQYRLSDDSRYTFSITGDYDRNAPLIIDPDLAWATFLGGSESIYGDYGNGIATDSGGNVFVSGRTSSSDFPTPNGWDTSFNGGDSDVFVAKFDSAGTLLWSTFLGGTSSDYSVGIVTDGEGNVFVTGETRSADFPTLNGWDTSFNGHYDAFVAKFDSAGTLLWSTYFGGTSDDDGKGIAVDGAGNAFVTGVTRSSDFPTPNGWDTTLNGSYPQTDAFVAKFDSEGALLWSTFLGGTSEDWGYRIAADEGGNVFVTGYTYSSDFPTPGGWDTSFNGGYYDAFVAKFDSVGALLWSTFLGGASEDWGNGIATDGEGNVFVTGATFSPDFPTPNGWDTSFNGYMDAFIAKFDSAGTLLWSTFLGDGENDRGTGIATDGGGNVFVTGYTSSSDFPTPSGWDTSHNGDYDAFVAKFNSAGPLLWSTFLGGSNTDYGYGIATDGEGNVFVTGCTYSSDFPTPNGWDTSHNGGYDAFVAKFTEPMYSLAVHSTPVGGIGIAGTPTGTTNYSTDLSEGTLVSLTAPSSTDRNYGFARWTINGVNQPDGQTAISFNINDDTVCVARYIILYVQSTPITGIRIVGTCPGNTNYTVTDIPLGRNVSLTAPRFILNGRKLYKFYCWTLDGAAKKKNYLSVAFNMNTIPRTAVAVYRKQWGWAR